MYNFGRIDFWKLAFEIRLDKNISFFIFQIFLSAYLIKILNWVSLSNNCNFNQLFGKLILRSTFSIKMLVQVLFNQLSRKPSVQNLIKGHNISFFSNKIEILNLILLKIFKFNFKNFQERIVESYKQINKFLLRASFKHPYHNFRSNSPPDIIINIRIKLPIKELIYEISHFTQELLFFQKVYMLCDKNVQILLQTLLEWCLVLSYNTVKWFQYFEILWDH